MGAGALPGALLRPEGAVFEGEADLVVAPAWDGEVGILRGHAPMMVLLGTGELRVRRGDVEQRFTVSGGFLQVVGDQVTVLSEHAEAA